jgi:hypothetical protein
MQEAHMAHLADLHEAGYLLAAGPLAFRDSSSDFRGRCGWYRSGVTACYSLQGGVGSPSSPSNPARR